MQQEWLTPTQVAEQLQLSTKTILRYIDEGKLLAHTLPGGGFRIRPEDVERMLVPARSDAEGEGAG